MDIESIVKQAAHNVYPDGFGGRGHYPEHCTKCQLESYATAEREMQKGLEKLWELSEKATAGKWEQESTYFSAYCPGGRPNGEIIGSAHPSVGGTPDWLPKEEQKANAAFIVACVNYVRSAILERKG